MASPPPSGGPPLFEYPTDYLLKVFGPAADDFAEHVRRLAERSGGPAPAELVTVRASEGGRYHAVTLTVTLASEERRLALYAALKADGRVLYAL